jgi:hypothetical protein
MQSKAKQAEKRSGRKMIEIAARTEKPGEWAAGCELRAELTRMGNTTCDSGWGEIRCVLAAAATFTRG